jgi:hypothetical protein
MSTYVLRVWLPDRPGALGAVASRVGAVRGDVVGIEIIDRGAGRAVDELTVDLPDDALLDLLVSEVRAVEGVDVEDVRALGAPNDDPAVMALAIAAAVTTAGAGTEVAEALATGAQALLRADWAAVVEVEGERLMAAAGDDPPTGPWLCAFVRGATADGGNADLEELAVAEAPANGWSLVVGRDHLPLRGRERAMLVGLAALA